MAEPKTSCLAIYAEPTAQWLAEALPRLLQAIPPERLRAQRWFGSKTHGIARLAPRDLAPFASQPVSALALVEVHLDDGAAETYFLPLAVRPLAEAEVAFAGDTDPLLLRLRAPGGEFALLDAAADPGFAREALAAMVERRAFPGAAGSFAFHATAALLPGHPSAPIRRLRGEQSNTSLLVGNQYVLKHFRKLQNGPNPDLEVPLYLTTRAGFAHTPPVAGYAEYRGDGFSAAVGLLTGYVANSGDCWSFALSHLRELYAHALQVAGIDVAGTGVASTVCEFSAAYLREARRLGEVTAELHLALAAEHDDPAFAPEPVTAADGDRWRESMEAQLAAALREAASAAEGYGEPERSLLRRFLAGADRHRRRLGQIRTLAGADVLKIRNHGDYHLGQVLRTGTGFAILDFEGEPARPLAERRAKHLALRDLAGMLRSFDYAAYAALFERKDEAGQALLEAYGRAWAAQAGAAFKEGYLLRTHGTTAAFLPASAGDFERVLDALLLDKAVYELRYELDNRPRWVRIPLTYIVASGA